MSPDHDPLLGEGLGGVAEGAGPGWGDWVGIWGRNCVHQGAGEGVEVRFGMDGTAVGTTVGSPLGRLGTRFKKPFSPLPLVPVVALALLVGAGVWPVPVSGSGTDGTLESAPRVRAVRAVRRHGPDVVGQVQIPAVVAGRDERQPRAVGRPGQPSDLMFARRQQLGDRSTLP